MNTEKIRTTLLALGAAAITTFGLAGCDTGTEPGEVNVARTAEHDEGSLIGDEPGNVTRYSDTADLEDKYYNEVDHEEHGEEGAEGTAVHAGDGKRGDQDVERDDL